MTDGISEALKRNPIPEDVVKRNDDYDILDGLASAYYHLENVKKAIELLQETIMSYEAKILRGEEVEMPKIRELVEKILSDKIFCGD